MMKENKAEEQIMAEIGKNIARLRKRKNMTQEELALQLHVSPQAVSKWENELSCPDIALLPQLASFFEVSVDALLGIVPLPDQTPAPAPEAEPAPAQEAPAPAAEPERAQPEPEPEEASAVPPLRNIRVEITKTDGKTVNVRLPIGIVHFGLGLGKTFGGLGDAQISAIGKAVDQGLRGEILDLTGEQGETIKVYID